MYPSLHNCPKNYEGSSKGMEATVALRLAVHAWEKRGFIVGCVVADDDSSMHAVLRNSYSELSAGYDSGDPRVPYNWT